MEENLSSREIFLEKLRGGDEDSRKPFAESLAESLLYVPVTVDGTKDGADGIVTVQVVTIVDDESRVIPVFSSKSLFTEWCGSQDEFYNSISVFGGDVADVIGSETSVLLDAGAEQEYLVDVATVSMMKAELDDSSAATVDDGQEDADSEQEASVVAGDADLEHDFDMDGLEASDPETIEPDHESAEPVLESASEQIEEASEIAAAEAHEAMPETDVVELTQTLDEFLADTADELSSEAAQESQEEETDEVQPEATRD